MCFLFLFQLLESLFRLQSQIDDILAVDVSQIIIIFS